MNRFFLFLPLLLIQFSVKSQDLSYGILVGGTGYSNASTGQPTFSSHDGFAPHFGAYAEYAFTEKWGLKTEVVLTGKKLSFAEDPEKFKFKMIELSPNLKLDFGDEYRSGAYLLFGPKLSFITAVTYDGANSADEFEKTTFGLQGGIGARMLKVLDVELKLNYDFTGFYKNPLNDNTDFFLGGNIALGLDIERLINRQANSEQQ